MSRFSAETEKLRRHLAKLPGITPLPQCPTCRTQVQPIHYSAHTRSCLARVIGLATDAIDRAQARLHATEPRDEAHAEQLAAEKHALWSEWLAWRAQTIELDERPCKCGKPDCTRYDVAF